MPVSGARPKPPGQAVHRNGVVHDWTTVVNVPFKGKVPVLPKLVPGADVPWPRRTRDAWAAWSRMPHCVLWSPADWSYALDTLAVAAQFHLFGEQKFATELRNREKVLGTTFDARQGLRIRYVEPEAAPRSGVAVVTKISDYAKL